MAQFTRGEFLKWVAVSGALGVDLLPRLGAQARTAAGTRNADLVVVNAKVYTSDLAQSRTEAFAVKDGKFIAVGTSADIRGMAGAQTQVIDAASMTVVPGFIDC